MKTSVLISCLTVAVGIAVTSVAIGTLYGPMVGLLTLGSGLMAFGLVGAIVSYLT